MHKTVKLKNISGEGHDHSWKCTLAYINCEGNVGTWMVP